MRVGRVFAFAALIGSVALGGAMLISAGGCSGSSGGGQATIDPEEQKITQEKMKEYLKNRPPLGKGGQHTKK
jgi:hypothetical protein